MNIKIEPNYENVKFSWSELPFGSSDFYKYKVYTGDSCQNDPECFKDDYYKGNSVTLCDFKPETNYTFSLEKCTNNICSTPVTQIFQTVSEYPPHCKCRYNADCVICDGNPFCVNGGCTYCKNDKMCKQLFGLDYICKNGQCIEHQNILPEMSLRSLDIPIDMSPTVTTRKNKRALLLLIVLIVILGLSFIGVTLYYLFKSSNKSQCNSDRDCPGIPGYRSVCVNKYRSKNGICALSI